MRKTSLLTRQKEAKTKTAERSHKERKCIMNKKDLVDFVAGETGTTKKDARIVTNAVIEGIANGLEKDGKVTLVGFGTFSVVERKARKARNPKTGAPIDVPAKMVPKFKPSKALKDNILGFTPTEAPVDTSDEEDTDTDE